MHLVSINVTLTLQELFGRKCVWVYILGFLHVVTMLQSMRSSMKQLGHVLRSVKVTYYVIS